MLLMNLLTCFCVWRGLGTFFALFAIMLKFIRNIRITTFAITEFKVIEIRLFQVSNYMHKEYNYSRMEM